MFIFIKVRRIRAPFVLANSSQGEVTVRNTLYTSLTNDLPMQQIGLIDPVRNSECQGPQEAKQRLEMELCNALLL
jgi:hypothetical protein